MPDKTQGPATEQRRMFPNRLGLTSPFTRGPDVQAAEHILHGANRLEQDFLREPANDIFKENTAVAVKHARYWLGYPGKLVDSPEGGHWDQELSDRLTGYKSWGAIFKHRRRKRLKRKRARASQGVKRKAMEIAQKEVGYHEGPNNDNKYGVAYGMNHAFWCAMFVTWCRVQAGDKDLFKEGSFSSYVPTILAAARAGKGGMRVTKNPEYGDLACWIWGPDSHHVGFVKHKNGNNFSTIEGNDDDAVRDDNHTVDSHVTFVHLPD